MKEKAQEIRPRFVESIPPGRPPAGEFLISIKYGMGVLRCPCGCGNTMDVNIEPHRWSIKWDGEHISVCPSISSDWMGCRSHYWVRRNRIVWGYPISRTAEEKKEKEEAKARERIYKPKSFVGNIWRKMGQMTGRKAKHKE